MVPPGLSWPSSVTKTPGEVEQKASCGCYVAHQLWLERIQSVSQGLDATPLDKVLQCLSEVSTHTVEYLNCKLCEDGCPRLINLAMLHQRVIGLLCIVSKNPATYIHSSKNDAIHFTIGEYRLSEEESEQHKRLLILSAANRAGRSVTELYDKIHRLHGHSGLTEAGKLNLDWLLDVKKNLVDRLKIIIPMLQKADWASTQV